MRDAVDDDDVLLEQFAPGEVDAFGVFYERHLPAMLGFFCAGRVIVS